MSETKNCITLLNEVANFINCNTNLNNNMIPLYETVKNIKLIELYITKLESDKMSLLDENRKLSESFEKLSNEINNKLDNITNNLKK